MNLYGVVTGTNDYSLNVSFPNSFRLSVGDTITIRPLNANTGASTLNIGFGAMPLTLNGAALANGQLEANKDRQCTFIGSGFALDSAAGGGASFVGTSSNLTLGDGSAGIVPAGNFGNLSPADIPSGLDMAKIAFAGIALSKSADQTGIVANTITDVTWTLETVSESSHLSHSTSSDTAQITVNTAGKYGIEVTLTLENTGSSNTYGLYNIYLYVNGTSVAIQQFSLYGSTATRPTRTIRAGWIRPLAATDVVKIAGYAASDNHDIKGRFANRDQTILLMTYLGA